MSSKPSASSPEELGKDKKEKKPALAHIHIPKGSLNVSLKGLGVEQPICITIEGKLVSFDDGKEYGLDEKSFRVDMDSLEIENRGSKKSEDMSMKEYRKSREE